MSKFSIIPSISGSGGGKGEDEGGAQRSPVESPDTLRSAAHAKVLDLLCEGEIQGLVNGLKSVYLDGVPIQNPDNSYNFKDVTLYTVKGTQSQEYIPGFPSIESETAVNTQVLNGTPIIRSITDANVTDVKVSVEVPQLTNFDATSGNLGPASVEIRIEVQNNGGGYVIQDLQGAQVIRGKCTSAFVRQYRVSLPGTGPWDIRVSRISSNSTSTYVAQTWWKSYTTVIDEKLSYPNSAIAALQVSAHQFNTIPTRSYRIKGLKVKIPANYNPTTRVYTGSWDGTFTTAWTDNPAWIFYDLLTTTRYGLGRFISQANVDKWGLYTIAQYCDGYVLTGKPKRGAFTTGSISLSADGSTNKYGRVSGSFITDGFAIGDEVIVSGFGNALNNGRAVISAVTASEITINSEKALVTEASGAGRTITTQDYTEPRFRCNLYLQAQEDAYQVMANLASIFRAMVYWASGAVYVAQDAPKDSEYLFTPANVVDGLFTYSSSSKRARHTAVIVTWNDPDDHFKQAKEFVSDEEGIVLWGYNPTDCVALGCTSKSQAIRVGKWLLYTERTETETITFRTGMEGAFRTPGAIITVQDPYRSGTRFGGRLVEGNTTTKLFLDNEIEIQTSVTYSVAVILANGVVAEAGVTNLPGKYRTLDLSVPLASVPTTDAVYIITASTLAPEKFRVISVTESEKDIYEVVALKHNSAKYASVESTVKLQTVTGKTIPASTAPTGLTLSETLYRTSADLKVLLSAKWNQVEAATSYIVRWKRGDDNYQQVEGIQSHHWELLDVPVGAHSVQVAAVVNGFVTSFADAVTYTVLGKTAAPSDVGGIVATHYPTHSKIEWNHISDLDWDYYEIRTGGTGWSDATVVAKIRGTQYQHPHPVVTGSVTIRIKAVDTSGNYSATAGSVTYTVNNAFNGSNLSNGVGQHDGTGVRILAKGHLSGSNRNGDSITFPITYQNPPLVIFRGGQLDEPRSKWGNTGDGTESGALDTTKPQLDDTVALNLTASGFTMRARLRQKATTTAVSVDANTANNIIDAEGETADATIASATSGAVADQYNVHYKVKVTCAADFGNPGDITGLTVTIAIDSSADGGTNWTERASFSYPHSNGSSTPSTATWGHENKLVTVSGLSSSSPADKIRIRAKLVEITGDGIASFEAHLFSTAATPTADPTGALTYNTASDQYASRTPDAADAIYWEAIEVN